LAAINSTAGLSPDKCLVGKHTEFDFKDVLVPVKGKDDQFSGFELTTKVFYDSPLFGNDGSNYTALQGTLPKNNGHPQIIKQIAAIKQYLKSNGPLSIYVRASDSSFSSYAGGVAICDPYSSNFSVTDHAITLVGYQDPTCDHPTGYWIARMNIRIR